MFVLLLGRGVSLVAFYVYTTIDGRRWTTANIHTWVGYSQEFARVRGPCLQILPSRWFFVLLFCALALHFILPFLWVRLDEVMYLL